MSTVLQPVATIDVRENCPKGKKNRAAARTLLQQNLDEEVFKFLGKAMLSPNGAVLTFQLLGDPQQASVERHRIDMAVQGVQVLGTVDKDEGEGLKAQLDRHAAFKKKREREADGQLHGKDWRQRLQ